MRTTQVLLTGVLGIALVCCGKQPTNVSAASSAGSKQGTISPETVEVPEFAIAVKLSSAADKKLRSIGESIKVLAMFDGDSLPGQGKYNPPDRDVYLGSAERAVDGSNVARFSGLRVPLADWNRLADKDYYVTINTFSARKADKNNLLDCNDPMSRRIQTFSGKTIDVQCRLIGESDGPAK